MLRQFSQKIFTTLIFAGVILCLMGAAGVFAQTITPTDTSTPTPTPNSSTTPTPTPTPDNSGTISDLQNQIKDYESKISDLQGQEKTFSSQIGIMSTQIKLTELRISATKEQIKELDGEIGIAKNKVTDLQKNIDTSTRALIGRIAAVYQVGSIKPWEMFLTADNIHDVFSRLTYLRVVQAYDKRKVYAAEQAKNDYANQKSIYEDKQAQAEALNTKLTAYTDQLDQEKSSKQTLLTQTQGSESNYQRLLAQANAQLAALAGFAKSVSGGATIIPHQDLSDSWGKYYNQRDANWGNNTIGSSSEAIWSVGCLLTSYTMVVTHYGGSLTPADVAANNSNFSVGTAYFNKPGPSANGHSVESRDNPSIQELKDALNSGGVVIAGLSRDGGPFPTHYSDHWVVLRSVDGDSFKINDPLYAGAINVSLNDHYAGWTIVESRIYH